MAAEPMSIFNFFRKSVRVLNRSVQEAKENYETFVCQNPETITQVEKTVNALSYALEFLPRDYENSIFLTELLKSANSLFVYVNDCILKKAGKVQIFGKDSVRLVATLERWLTIVEFMQAFIEMSARRLGGRGASWAVIVVISLIKAVMRLILLHWFKSGIQTHPPVKQLKRESLLSPPDDTNQQTEATRRPFVYVGRRTGHVMRTLAHTPPMHTRTWEAPDSEDVTYEVDGATTTIGDLSPESPTNLTRQEQAGETLHIIRPLIHLITVGFFGTSSMIPWLTSLVTDASSHTLLSSGVKSTWKSSYFNKTERRELQRRALIMTFYLLRSPVYDRYTKTRILQVIQFLSDHVPLVRFVLQPLARYLPVWQQVYFYTWSE